MGASAAIPVLDDLMRHELQALLQAVGARRGYLAVYAADDAPGEPSWWVAKHYQPGAIAAVVARVSRGGTARALALGDIAEGTSSLCAPIGAAPPAGVVFIETAGAVTPGQRRRFEELVASLSPRLVRALSAAERDDPLAPLRARLCLDGLDGASPALVAMLEHVAEVAPLEAPVLVYGPSGAGKGRVARILHQNGAWGRGPFVQLCVDALDGTTIDDVLRGRGALGGKPGILAMAQGGTLHLDDYGAHDPAIESKLSAVLAQRPAGCRIVASTWMAPEALASGVGGRPSALCDVLLEHVVTVPSLAERPDDIPILARAIRDECVRRHGLPPMDLSPGAMRWLAAANLPGNVRMLAHYVERGMILAKGEPSRLVQVRHLTTDPQPPTLDELAPGLRATALARELVDSGWDLDQTIRRLDLRRAELYRMIREHGLAA